MKPITLKAVRCSRCRDVLSKTEKLDGNGLICAFCTLMYAEALDICQSKRTANALALVTQKGRRSGLWPAPNCHEIKRRTTLSHRESGRACRLT
jgi:hypothetical protein